MDERVIVAIKVTFLRRTFVQAIAVTEEDIVEILMQL